VLSWSTSNELGNDAYPDPTVELFVLEKIEAGRFRFTVFEFERIQEILTDYAARDDSPRIDREPANDIVEHIEAHCPTDVPR
jgi:hypothetical protein